MAHSYQNEIRVFIEGWKEREQSGQKRVVVGMKRYAGSASEEGNEVSKTTRSHYQHLVLS